MRNDATARRRLGVGLLAALTAAALGCSAVSVRKVRPESTTERVQAALFLQSPSPATAAILARAGAGAGLPFNAIQSAAYLERAETAAPADPAAVVARAELNYRAGREAEVWARDRAPGLYLAAVAESYGLLAGGAPGATAEQLAAAATTYNQAFERLLRRPGLLGTRPDRDLTVTLAGEGICLKSPDAPGLWDPDDFDDLLFADDYTAIGMRAKFRSDGLGVPLMAVRKQRRKDLIQRSGPEKYSPEVAVYPVTAVLRLNAASPATDRPEAVLELHDPQREDALALGGRAVPLAADLTTPLAYHLAQTDLAKFETLGLLDPQREDKQTGLYLLHPYEPGKVPVVLIHGLWSSPRTWVQAVNELRADPELRAHYQFWTYQYPTGFPFAQSAAKLRAALYEVREACDPKHADPAFEQMVLVGHSMGGLLAKTMLQSSGDELWRVVCRRPFEQLRGDSDKLAMLRAVFFFEPQPYVARAVFIGTPHRGSWLGDVFVGRWASDLIHFSPARLRDHRALVTRNGPDNFNPEYRLKLPSSIDLLGTDDPLLRAVDRLPFRPGVPFHTIAGQVDWGPPQKGTDGVVAYVSAHKDGAASELVVPHAHTSCHDCPETVAELRRILRLHLAEGTRELPAKMD